MQFSIAMAAAALVGSTAAVAFDAPQTATVALGALGIHPPAAEITGAVERRGADLQCASSVENHILSNSATNSALMSALTSAIRDQGGLANPLNVNLCTVTLPSSLSSAYSSFLDDARTGLDSKISYLKGLHTKCGVNTFMISIEPVCTSASLAAVFTGGSSGATATTASFSAVPPAQETVVYVGTGVAPGIKSSLLSVAAVAAAAGFTLMM